MSVPLATRKGRWRKYRSTVVALLRLEVAPAEASACQRRTTYCFLRGSKVGSLAILLATRRNKDGFLQYRVVFLQLTVALQPPISPFYMIKSRVVF
jgi:hypothetical protein